METCAQVDKAYRYTMMLHSARERMTAVPVTWESTMILGAGRVSSKQTDSVRDSVRGLIGDNPL